MGIVKVLILPKYGLMTEPQLSFPDMAWMALLLPSLLVLIAFTLPTEHLIQYTLA